MRHLVLDALSNSCVDNGFGDHFDTMEICSSRESSFVDVVFRLGAYIFTIPLLPLTFKSLEIMN
jgi:hypothetical protein